MKNTFLCLVLTAFVFIPAMALASTYQIFVSAQNDAYYSHEWWSGGHYNYTNYSSDSIETSYWYEPGSGGRYEEARLTFDLSDLSGVSADDIVSATFNMNITSSYNSNPSDSRGNYGTRAGGIVYGSKQYDVTPGLTGWTAYDFTDEFKTKFGNGDTTAFLHGDHNNLPYDGAGYSFTSAEEGHPAYLEVTTAGSPVPVPSSIALLLCGLLGLAGIKKLSRNN